MEEKGKLMPPRKTIRAHCLECREGTFSSTRDCDNTECSLHPYRHGKKSMFDGEKYRPTRAIREYCLWCCIGDPREVRLCPSVGCHLHPYRMGHRPKP